MAGSSVHYATIISTAATAISAIASVALVLIAILFREEVRAARRRPNMDLLFDMASASDCITLAIGSREECWVRFRARNDVSKEVAVGAQLLLLEVTRDGATEHPAVPVRPFHATDMEVGSTRVAVTGGVDRLFDIFHLARESSPDAAPLPGELILALEPQSSVARDRLQPGRYILLLALVADNCDATYWRIGLLFKKPWLPADTLSDAVEISGPVRAERS